jgi:hypothetical protein
MLEEGDDKGKGEATQQCDGKVRREITPTGRRGMMETRISRRAIQFLPVLGEFLDGFICLRVGDHV